MVRLAILDQDGKAFAAKDVGTAEELVKLAEQAISVIRECEQLASQRTRKPGQSAVRQIPYG